MPEKRKPTVWVTLRRNSDYDGSRIRDSKKQLKKLDKSIQKKIIEYLEEVAELEDPRTRGKGLSSNLAGLWCYRVGDYRLICEIKDEILTVEVVRIGHRREIYD